MDKRVVRLAELEIDPARLEAYTMLLAEEIEAAVRLEPGVLMLHAVAVAAAPNQIRLLEVYADAAAYQAHLLTPHFLKYKAQTADMVLALRLLPALPIAMQAKEIQP